jgi:hypothetical protein
MRENLYRLDAQAVNAIKVAAVISEQSEVVLEGGGGDHQIHVADALTHRPKSATFPAEPFTRLLINTQNG